MEVTKTVYITLPKGVGCRESGVWRGYKGCRGFRWCGDLGVWRSRGLGLWGSGGIGGGDLERVEVQGMCSIKGSRGCVGCRGLGFRWCRRSRGCGV